MRDFRLLFVISYCLILSACTGRVVVKQGDTFDLESAIQVKKSTVLSDLSDSVMCIPLETTDSSLLADRAYLLYADERDIFVRSNSLIYRFRSDGHFLNTIGCIGNGPGEYNMLYSVLIDRNRACLLFYLGQRKVQLWTYEGAFQKEIVLQGEGEITAIRLLGKDKILAENRIYAEAGLKTSIHLFDLDGNLQEKMPIHQDHSLVNLSMSTVPLMYARKEIVKYKSLYDDKFYFFTGDSLGIQCSFDLGRYTPSRELLEDVDKKETLLRDFAQLVDIQECDNYFYLLLVHANSLKGVVLDKKKGELVYSQLITAPQSGGGIKNDYIDGSFFWPSFVDDSNAMYCLLPVERITATGKENLKQHLIKGASFAEDANPVVLKASLAPLP